MSSSSTNYNRRFVNKVETIDEEGNTSNNGKKITRFDLSPSKHHYYPGDTTTNHEKRKKRKWMKDRGLSSTGLQSAFMAYTHTRSRRQQEQEQEDDAFRWCWNPKKANGNNKQQLQMKAEFVSEIRQLARLRHPCITTVMVSFSGNQTTTAIS